MRHKLRLSALLAMTLVTATSSAFAQNTGAAGAGGVTPGMGGVPPVGTTTTNPGSAGISSAPGGPSTTGTGTAGMGTGSSMGINPGPGRPQPGAPNTTTPGTIGTSATPSNLPGDYPAHPGFPGKVGN